MRFFHIVVSLLLLSSSLLAYEDQDIDGVDDNKDLCPNTPFDVLVDENGCDHNKKFLGKLTLQIGADVGFDTLSNRSTNINLYANYNYKQWDISLASSNYGTTNIETVNTSNNDLYLTTGYLFQNSSLKTKISIGTKFSLTDDETESRDNDYFASLNFNYSLNEKQNIFFYYSYTLSGDSAVVDYNDFNSYSIGSGYSITNKWYSAISYNYADSAYQDYEAYKAISWFNSYAVSDDFYVACNYAYALDDISYEHIISFNIGVYFD